MALSRGRRNTCPVDIIVFLSDPEKPHCTHALANVQSVLYVKDSVYVPPGIFGDVFVSTKWNPFTERDNKTFSLLSEFDPKIFQMPRRYLLYFNDIYGPLRITGV